MKHLNILTGNDSRSALWQDRARLATSRANASTALCRKSCAIPIWWF